MKQVKQVINPIQIARKSLNVNQKELANLLGVSVRAVQSYEQGWRPIPQYIQKLTMLMLFLRHSRGKKIPLCWKVMDCPKDRRQSCPSKQHANGRLCWIILGTTCGGKTHKTWDEKMEQCSKCPVVSGWMAKPRSDLQATNGNNLPQRAQRTQRETAH